MPLPRQRRLPPIRRSRLAALPPAICLALVPLLAGAPAVLAQPQEGRGGLARSHRGIAPTIDIDFEGGSIGDYLEAVKKAAAPAPVNVIVSDDVARLKANPVELQGVSVETAIFLLGQGQVLTPEPLRVGPAAGGGDSAVVYLISSGRMPEEMRARQQRPPQRSVQVFSIRDLVEPDPASPGALTIDPETLMSSIDAAMSLHGESEERDVLFHPEAGILIVRAENDELGVTTALLNEIRNDLNARRNSAQRAGQELQHLERQVNELEAQRQIAEAEMDYARRRLEEVEKLAAQGGGTQAALEEMRLEHLRAEANVHAIERQLEAAMRQLRERQSGAPAGDDRQSLLNEITRLKAEIAALRAELGRGERDDGSTARGDR